MSRMSRRGGPTSVASVSSFVWKRKVMRIHPDARFGKQDGKLHSTGQGHGARLDICKGRPAGDNTAVHDCHPLIRIRSADSCGHRPIQGLPKTPSGAAAGGTWGPLMASSVDPGTDVKPIREHATRAYVECQRRGIEEERRATPSVPFPAGLPSPLGAVPSCSQLTASRPDMLLFPDGGAWRGSGQMTGILWAGRVFLQCSAVGPKPMAGS